MPWSKFRQTDLLYFSTKAGSFCSTIALRQSDQLTNGLPAHVRAYLVLLSKLGESTTQDKDFLLAVGMQLFLQLRVYPGRFRSSDLGESAVCE
jgi:hypothetical protein